MSNPKTILITGATSGVGYEVAKRLLAEGHLVQVTGRNEKPLAELKRLGAQIFQVDLSETGSIDLLLSEIAIPDIILFSAGIAKFALAQETNDFEMEEMFTVNVTAPIQLTQRILPLWIERKNGHFLYMGSQAGKVATPKASVYAATKHALLGYTDALRMEVAQYGIEVSVIHPGPIDTAFLEKADASGKYRDSVGKHLLTVDQVAEAVVKTIRHPRREVDLPKIMGITSKLHAIAPSLVERIGRKFFIKKME